MKTVLLILLASTVLAQSTISGTVRYHLNNSPMPAVMSLSLLSCPDYMIDTSDINGFFEFCNVPDSTYFISAKEVLLPPSAYNGTDAMLAACFSVGLNQLDNLQRIAADVNNSGYVNAIDCLIIAKAFTYGTFLPFKWLSEQKQITYINSPITIDVICYGDVNCSYNP